MTAMLPIFRDLMDHGLISEQHKRAYATSCRDLDISVYRDEFSGVIYLSPDFQGKSGDYYESKDVNGSSHPRSAVDKADTDRRHALMQSFMPGKRYLDVGSGLGYQLLASRGIASELMGIELSKEGRDRLEANGIRHADDVSAAADFRPEVISFFHVIEHLSDPISVLATLYQSCPVGAKLILEVPHARDYLLMAGSDAFRAFTLWSEHLVLHTRQSLQWIAEKAGWTPVETIGVQRYPVWNHVGWLQTGKPTGLSRSALDGSAQQLAVAYEAFLAARDMTDTLILHAEKKG